MAAHPRRPAPAPPGAARSRRLDAVSAGYLLGLLAGEGHFGGDGRQPQVTLRMHVRHEKLFRWLLATFPESRLYGPYHHGGRDYYQWMARGAFLRETLVPLVRAHRALLDEYVAARFDRMCASYGLAAPREAGPRP
jgi:hypothetical protein